MPLPVRMIAALLSLTLVPAAAISHDSNGVTNSSFFELDMIFPEDEFSEFSSCLFKGQSECFAHLAVSDVSMTVNWVTGDEPRAADEESCRYYSCDYNIDNIDGQFVCHHQEKSAACKTRLQPQFLWEPPNIQRKSACVLLNVTHIIGRFTSVDQASFDICNAACSCHTSGATTHASSKDIDTTTVRPRSTETTAITTTTTAPTITTETTPLSSIGHTTEILPPTNTTNVHVKTINESSDNENETLKNTRSNDSMLGTDTDKTVKIVVPVIVVVACVVCGLVVGIVIICKIRRKYENRRDDRHDAGAPGQDDESNANLLTEHAERSIATRSIPAFAETKFTTMNE